MSVSSPEPSAATDPGSGGGARLRALLRHPRAPLVMATLLQLAAAAVFAGSAVPGMLPDEDTALVVFFTRAAPLFRGLFYGLLALAAAALWLGRRDRPRLVLGGLVLAVAALTGHAFHTVLLYPLLLRVPPDAGADGRDDARHRWPATLALGLLLGGIALMTELVVFPHDTAFRTGYMLGLAVLYLLPLLAGYALLAGAVSAVLAGPGRADSANRTLLANALMQAGVYVALALALWPRLGPVGQQFGQPALPWLFTSLAWTLLHWLLAPARRPAFGELLSCTWRTLAARWLWLKLLLALWLTQQALAWLNGLDKDLLRDLAQDTVNVLFPVICLLFGLAIAQRVARLRVAGRVAAGLAMLGLFTATGFYFAHAGDADTFNLERRRALPRYVAGHLRALLAHVGVHAGHGAHDAKLRWLLERQAAWAAAGVGADDVFGPEIAPAAPAPSASKVPGPAGRPHIFLFLSDATSAAHLSAYGHGRETSPHLARFAQDAAVFDNFQAASSGTILSVRAIFAGRYLTNRSGDDWRRNGTLCDDLAAAGYRLFVSGVGRAQGLTAGAGTCPGVQALSLTGAMDEDWALLTTALRDPAGGPVFAYLHVRGGHNPWNLAPEDFVFGRHSDEKYDAALRVADRHFGEFLRRLEASGQAGRSVVIFTADHGFGTRPTGGAFTDLYASNLHIPFVMRVPGGRARHVAALHSHVDIRPTLARLAGAPALPGLHGRSMPDALSDAAPASARCVYAATLYTDRVGAICPQSGKLIYFRDFGYIELYAVGADPDERHNLIDEMPMADYEPLAARLAGFLALGADSFAR